MVQVNAKTEINYMFELSIKIQYDHDERKPEQTTLLRRLTIWGARESIPFLRSLTWNPLPSTTLLKLKVQIPLAISLEENK
jgi:hypothetical protein